MTKIIGKIFTDIIGNTRVFRSQMFMSKMRRMAKSFMPKTRIIIKVSVTSNRGCRERKNGLSFENIDVSMYVS